METVHFALDGHFYEIDLNPEHATVLGEKLERFVEAAHPVKAARRAVRKQVIKTGPVSKETTQAIRHWAKENGYHSPTAGESQQT